jgi:methyl-accepting chemotaxis protein
MKNTNSTAANTAAEPAQPGEFEIRWYRSIGAQLWIAVLVGGIAGLGLLSYLSYEAVTEETYEELVVLVDNKSKSIEIQLKQAEESSRAISTAAATLSQQFGMQDAESFRKLAFQFFLKRPPLVMGNGFGQAPHRMIPSLEGYWPYFYVDQGVANPLGQLLPPPHQTVRHTDLYADDHYFKQGYYTDPAAAGKMIWSEPYDWFGITMTSCLDPFFDADGKLLGVTGSDVNVTELARQMQVPALDGEGYFVLVSQQGKLLAYPPAPEKAQARVDYGEIPAIKAIWPEVQNKGQGMLENAGQIWVYQKIPATGWILLASVPKWPIIRPILQNILIGLASGGVLLLFIVQAFLRRLNRRLQNLADSAGRLAALDLTVGLARDKEDEIGGLFNALNTMILSFRQMLHKVQYTALRISESAAELSATTRQQEAVLVNQLDTARQISDALKQISVAASQLTATFQRMVQYAQQTAQTAGEGQSSLGRMGNAMQQMEQASRSVSQRLGSIHEKTNNITHVVTTITKVSDQTNLLSLNAAIEAEKAGESGRGFTVVAREIRRLADQTAVATLDIENMVKEMQNAVSSGVMEIDNFINQVRHNTDDVRQVGTHLNTIIEQVQALTPNFQQVNQVIEYQSSNSEQISKSLQELSENMEATTASLRETFLAVGQLEEVARSLQQELTRFKLEAGKA